MQNRLVANSNGESDGLRRRVSCEVRHRDSGSVDLGSGNVFAVGVSI